MASMASVRAWWERRRRDQRKNSADKRAIDADERVVADQPERERLDEAALRESLRELPAWFSRGRLHAVGEARIYVDDLTATVAE